MFNFIFTSLAVISVIEIKRRINTYLINIFHIEAHTPIPHGACQKIQWISGLYGVTQSVQT